MSDAKQYGLAFLPRRADANLTINYAGILENHRNNMVLNRDFRLKRRKLIPDALTAEE